MCNSHNVLDIYRYHKIFRASNDKENKTQHLKKFKLVIGFT